MRQVNPPDLLIVFLFMLLVSACAENEEGCLDVRAVNFDIEADENCCCEYPVMNLEVSPIFGSDTVPFRAGDPFISSGGAVAKVLASKFYARRVQLEAADGDLFEITDRLDLCYNDIASGQDRKIDVTDDVFLFNLGNLRYEIGTFPDADTYQTLRLFHGLGDTLAYACREDLPNGHPLKNVSMYDGQQGKILDLSLIVIPDTNHIEDTLYIRASDISVETEILREIIIPERRDFIIPLTFDYKTWFNNIDFRNENEPSVVNKLIQNFPDSWDIKD